MRQREIPKSLLNFAVACGVNNWRFAPWPMFIPLKDPWATSGTETGRNAEAVGDNFCSPLEALLLETKGSFSAAAETAPKPSTGLAWK